MSMADSYVYVYIYTYICISSLYIFLICVHMYVCKILFLWQIRMYMCIHIHIYIYKSCLCIFVVLHLIGCAARYRVAKTHRMPYLYRSFSTKEPPIIGLFCGKWPAKIRHPIGLRHPVMQPDTMWQRPIGCLILQVIFRKRATKYCCIL